MTRHLLSGLLLSLVPLVAQAQQSLKYQPEFEKGQVVRTETEIAIEQTLTLAGMPLETSNSMFMVTRDAVRDTTADGGHVFAGDFEIVQSEMSLPGGMTIRFNSNNPDQDAGGPTQEMIASFLRAMADAEWMIKTGPDHQVISAEYTNEPFADVNPYFKSDASPELIKKRTNTELARYPTEPVRVGDTWTRREEFQAGGGQSFVFEQEFKLLGTKEQDGRTFDQVGMKTLSVKLTVEDNPSAPATVTESDLKVADSEATLWYDRAAGRFTEGQEKVHVTGTATVEAQGMKFPGKLDLTIKSKSSSKVIDP